MMFYENIYTPNPFNVFFIWFGFAVVILKKKTAVRVD